MLPALAANGLLAFGTLVGFSLLKQKNSWYLCMYYVHMSLLAAIPIWYGLSKARFDRWYIRSAGGLALPTVFLAASFSSLFLHHQRPVEAFFTQASRKMGTELQGQAVDDCVPFGAWKGPFNYAFHLGVQPLPCTGKQRFAVYDFTQKPIPPGVKLRVVSAPFALIERSQ